MKKMLVGLLSVFAMLIVAPMLDTGNVVHAQWDGPGLSPDVCDDDPNAFCITQIRRSTGVVPAMVHGWPCTTPPISITPTTRSPCGARTPSIRGTFRECRYGVGPS